MRRIALATMLLGCHSRDVPPDASASTCSGRVSTVYLGRTGGRYQPGADDSGANTSPLVKQTATIGAWDDPGWPAARDCITQRLAPFEIAVTETDPGTAEHIEIVLSPGDASEIGLSNQADAVDVSECRPLKNGVHFVWPNDVSNAPDQICDLVVEAVGFAAGLERTSACGDAMSFSAQESCVGGFTDADLPCLGNGCRCGGTTQNSFQAMAEAFGRCP